VEAVIALPRPPGLDIAWQTSVQGNRHAVRWKAALRDQAHHLSDGVDPGVGAPGPNHPYRLAGGFPPRRLDISLHAAPGRETLEPLEIGPIVRNNKLQSAGHSVEFSVFGYQPSVPDHRSEAGD
jgi:hypothetical protein